MTSGHPFYCGGTQTAVELLKRSRWLGWLCSLFMLIALGAPVQAQFFDYGQNVYWTGNANGDWQTYGNWANTPYSPLPSPGVNNIMFGYMGANNLISTNTFNSNQYYNSGVNTGLVANSIIFGGTSNYTLGGNKLTIAPRYTGLPGGTQNYGINNVGPGNQTINFSSLAFSGVGPGSGCCYGAGIYNTAAGGSITVNSPISFINNFNYLEIYSPLYQGAPGSSSVTINGDISGNVQALWIAGTNNNKNTVTLAGNNSFTTQGLYLGGDPGAVRLQISSDAALGATSNTLRFTTANAVLATTATTASSRSFSLEAGPAVFDVANGTTFTVNGQISNFGNINKTNSGTLILNNANNNYGGGTVISGGTLQVSQDGNLGAQSSGIFFYGAGTLRAAGSFGTSRTVSLDATGTIDVADSQGLTLNGQIYGAGGLVKSGNGALVLFRTNTYTGGTTINGGSIAIDRDASLGAAGTSVILNGGTISAQADIATGRAFTIGANGGVFGVTSGATYTVNNSVTGGNVKKQGAGTLTLTRANAFSSLFIENGTVLSAHDGALGAGSTTVTVDTAGVLRLGSSSGSNIAALSGSGSVIFNTNNVLAITGGGGNFSGAISGGGSLQKFGAGTQILSGISSYTGGTLIAGGTLQITRNEALGANSGGLTMANAAVLTTTNDFTMSRNIDLQGGGGRIDTAGNLGLSGVISGGTAGTFIKSGAGTLTLSGANTYTGATNITQGTLALKDGGSIAASSSVSVAAGAALNATFINTGRTITGSVNNQGDIYGGTGANWLSFTGAVKGAGSYHNNVAFNGSFGPGNSPALVSMDNAIFGSSNTLSMELGGLTRGSQYDAIDALTLTLGGTLSVSLIDLGGGPFAPTAGNTFDLLKADTITGIFAQFDFTSALLADGLAWSWGILDVGGFDIFRLSVISTASGDGVPEPAVYGLLILGLLMIAAFRRLKSGIGTAI